MGRGGGRRSDDSYRSGGSRSRGSNGSRSGGSGSRGNTSNSRSRSSNSRDSRSRNSNLDLTFPSLGGTKLSIGHRRDASRGRSPNRSKTNTSKRRTNMTGSALDRFRSNESTSRSRSADHPPRSHDSDEDEDDQRDDNHSGSRSRSDRSRKSERRRSDRSHKSGRSKRSEDRSRGSRKSNRRSDRYDRKSRSRREEAPNFSTSLVIEQTPALVKLDSDYRKEEQSKDRHAQWTTQFPSGHVVIYVDGSVKRTTSGFGIYMGPNHPLNRSEYIKIAPHDNNRAEILGATRALWNLRDWDGYKNEPVIVRTESLMLIRHMNGKKRIELKDDKKRKKRDRSSAELDFDKFVEELAELRRTAEKLNGGVCFEHVPAHCDHPGNLAADELSRQSTASGPKKEIGGSSESSYDRSQSAERDGSRMY